MALDRAVNFCYIVNMERERESVKEMLQEAVELLAQHLGVDVDQVNQEVPRRNNLVDALVHANEMTFVLELSHKSTSESVLRKAHQLMQYQASVPGAVVPILVVPYMGEAGSALCKQVKLSWLDLSGNADIRSAGLTIKVSGRANRYKRRGRPRSLFAAQSLRVTRWLLMNPDDVFTHSDVVEQTKIDRGYATRVLSRMTEEGYIKRRADRSYQLYDAARLLQDWYMSNSFNRHDVVAGSCFSTSGPRLVREMAKLLDESSTRYAFTGLPATWLYTRHVSFVLTTLYVDAPIRHNLMKRLGFHKEARGANTWLVQPDDQGVFDGIRKVDGVTCAHPVQVYIDLKDQPERASEATDEILTLSEFELLREK